MIDAIAVRAALSRANNSWLRERADLHPALADYYGWADYPLAREALPDLYSRLSPEQIEWAHINTIDHPWEQQQAAVLRRFHSRVDRTGGPDACHLWTGTVSNAGHGMFSFKDRSVEAHRFICAAVHDPMATQIEASHVRPGCLRLCVNPAHIHPGTRAQSMQDRRFHGEALPVRRPARMSNDMHAKVGRWVKRMLAAAKDDVRDMPRSGRLLAAEVRAINAAYARRFRSAA